MLKIRPTNYVSTQSIRIYYTFENKVFDLIYAVCSSKMYPCQMSDFDIKTHSTISVWYIRIDMGRCFQKYQTLLQTHDLQRDSSILIVSKHMQIHKLGVGVVVIDWPNYSIMKVNKCKIKQNEKTNKKNNKSMSMMSRITSSWCTFNNIIDP